MKNFFRKTTLALAGALLLTACDDEPDGLTPPPALPGEKGIVVLNQGSYYSGIESTADVLDLAGGTYTPRAFAAANGLSLGADAQDGLRYGDCIWVAMYGSDLVWKLDASTLAVRGSVAVRQPEGLAATDGFVYVTGNDGLVSRIDTLTLGVQGTVEVGPNPAGIVAAGGWLYAAVSDGYNAAGGYASGFKVARIHPRSLRVEREIRVGMNPTAMAADGQGNVFVACQGNYGTVRPEVYKIAAGTAEAAPFCPGTKIDCRGSELYVIYDYTDYYDQQTYERELAYRRYDTATGQMTAGEMLDAADLPLNPYSIDVSPATGEIFIGSYAGAWDFTSPGLLYRYSGDDGRLVARYATSGPGPCAVIFN